MKIALVQMASSDRKEQNLAKSIQLYRKALEGEPNLIIFPEYQMIVPDYGSPEALISASEPLKGDFVSKFIELSKENRTKTIINIAEQNFGTLKPFNTSIFIDDLGVIAGKYRKLHLFDAYSMTESNLYEPGRLPLNTIGTDKCLMGLQICYDLRFPEPARILALQGAKILSYQAGWYAGERKLDTWRTMLRARAIENSVFVIASAQSGPLFTGHSLVASPYGDILAELDDKDGVLQFDLDFSLLDKYAVDVPMMKQRRKDIYELSGL